MRNLPETEEMVALLKQSVQNGRKATVIVTSNSMAPLIRRGDRVKIVAVTRPLRPGDIITVSTPSGLLTHRFWAYVPGAEPPLLMMRGDKPLVFDPPTPAANVLGQVLMRQRHGRWLHLYQGRGLWLNRLLSKLAAVDNRVLAGRTPLHHAAASQPAWWRQGIHWVLQYGAWGVTAVISISYTR